MSCVQPREMCGHVSCLNVTALYVLKLNIAVNSP